MSSEPSPSFCKDVIKKYDAKELARPVYVIQEHGPLIHFLKTD